MLLWVIAAVALLGAGAAMAATRRLSRKLDALNQSYWELRYDFTRLRSQVSRLDPAAPEPEPEPAPPADSTVTFVALSSLKKKD